MIRAVLLATGLTLLTACAMCADWPGYLGPNGDATSSETGLLRSWPEGGPEVIWTASLNAGFSGAAAVAGKVYVHDRVDDQQDILRCLDLATGKEEWTYSYAAPGRLRQPGARCVPAVDGDFVYTCGPMGHLVCVNRQTHEPVWWRHIWDYFGGGAEGRPMWEFAQNPLIHGDLLIIAPQTPTVGVVALDKRTGDTKWSSGPLSPRSGYVSPQLVTLNGEDQIVAIGPGQAQRGLWGGGGNQAAADQPVDPKTSGGVAGLDPETGKTLWSYYGWQCQTPVPNVTQVGEDRLFITGGYRSGSAMIKIEKQGDEYTVTELFKTDEFGTHIHPPILYEGHLYGQCTDNTGRADGLVCMDIDGKVKWKTGKDPAFDKGGMLLADGLIFSVDGIEGNLYLIEPDPNEFKPLAAAKVLNTRQCWAPLALSDGKLLVRDQGQLKCLKVK